MGVGEQDRVDGVEPGGLVEKSRVTSTSVPDVACSDAELSRRSDRPRPRVPPLAPVLRNVILIPLLDGHVGEPLSDGAVTPADLRCRYRRCSLPACFSSDSRSRTCRSPCLRSIRTAVITRFEWVSADR